MVEGDGIFLITNMLHLTRLSQLDDVEAIK
jgi:hypothetical protein